MYTTKKYTAIVADTLSFYPKFCQNVETTKKVYNILTLFL